MTRRVVGLGIGPTIVFLQSSVIGMVLSKGDSYWKGIIDDLVIGGGVGVLIVILISFLPQKLGEKIIVDWPDLVLEKFDFLKEK